MQAELVHFTTTRRQRELINKMRLIVETDPKARQIHVTPKQFERLKIIAKGADELTYKGRMIVIYDEHRI